MNGSTNIAVQGIDYPASIAGFVAGGSPDGAATMARLTSETMQRCPKAAVVLSGYSQGAQVVHLAAQQMPADMTAKIGGVVLLGAPRNGPPAPGTAAARVMTACHA